jgi:hypothetical protein
VTHELAEYEGLDVVESTIRVTNAGDGLSSALEVDPVAFELDELVYVVLECRVARVGYEQVKDSGGALRRVHTFRARTGTIVDRALVHDVVDKQRRRIAEARGELELDLEPNGDEPEVEP